MNLAFENDKFRFINYVNISSEQSEIIFYQRNKDSVRRWMTDDQIITEEEHYDFLGSLEKSADKYYWLILRKNMAIGSVNIVNLDPINKTGDWGLYLFEEYQGTGWGIDIEFYALSIFFRFLHLTEVRGLVNKDNSNSITIQPIFNFRLKERLNNQIIFVLTQERYFELPEDLTIFKKEKILNNGKNH